MNEQEQQVATLARETTSSIEVQRAKDGTYYWTLKRYWDGSSEGEKLEALADLQQLDGLLREHFLPSGIE